MEVQRVKISWALGLGGTFGALGAASFLMDLASSVLSDLTLQSESVLVMESVLKQESVLVFELVLVSELRRSERLRSELLPELGLTSGWPVGLSDSTSKFESESLPEERLERTELVPSDVDATLSAWDCSQDSERTSRDWALGKRAETLDSCLEGVSESCVGLFSSMIVGGKEGRGSLLVRFREELCIFLCRP